VWIRGNNPALDATKVPTAIDIAWSAGIFEGEGHPRRTRKRGLEVGVTQKDPEILYRLREWFGGSVAFARCSTIPADQQVYRWSLCGDRARLFLSIVYHFLSARRKYQVDEMGALDFLCGESPEHLSTEALKVKLKSWYDVDRSKKTSSPEYWRTEEFRAKNRENMRRYYNDTDVATREAIRKNVIQECFFVDTPLQDILRKSGAVEEFLGGTGMMEPFNLRARSRRGSDSRPNCDRDRPQISSAAKYQEKAYATFVQIEDFDLDVINRPGDTQILDKRALLEANLVSQLNTMLEMDLYRHGQPSAANGGTSASPMIVRRPAMDSSKDSRTAWIRVRTATCLRPRRCHQKRCSRPGVQLDALLLRPEQRRSGTDFLQRADEHHRAVADLEWQAQVRHHVALRLGRAGKHAALDRARRPVADQGRLGLRVAVDQLLRRADLC
jgi:hypothetical protein